MVFQRNKVAVQGSCWQASSTPAIPAVLTLVLLVAVVRGEQAVVTHSGGYDVTRWTTNEGLPENDITGVARMRDGHLLVGTRNRGLSTFNGVSFRTVPVDEGIASRVHSLFVTTAGIPIVSLLGGPLASVQGGRLVMEGRPIDIVAGRRRLLSRYLGFRSGGDHFLMEDGRIFVRDAVADPGRVRWRLAADADHHLLPAAAAGDHVAEGAGGRWVVAAGGLRHEPVDGLPVTLDAARLRFEVSAVQSMTADHEGNLWLGLRRQGLVRIRRTSFRPPMLADGDAVTAASGSLCQDSTGAIWLTSPGGEVWRSGGFADGHRFEPVVAAVRPITDESVIAAAAAGGVWVATQFAGLFRIHDGIPRRMAAPEEFGFVARSLLEHDGTLWLGGEEGLFAMAVSGGPVNRVPVDLPGATQPLMIEAIAPAPGGGLWLGVTRNRLVHRATDGTSTLHRAPWSRPGARFWALLPDALIPGREDVDGVWIGTLGDGLLWFDAAHSRFHRITSAEGLPDDTICQLLADTTGSLWLGTYRGVVRAAITDITAVFVGDRATVACRRFGIDDGLPAAQCSSGRQPNCLAARDGSLWFTTDSGVVVGDPSSWPVAVQPPPVVIEEVSVGGRPQAFGAPTPLLLGARDRQVAFSFAGLWLANPEQVRYRWRIAGVDADWIDGGPRRSAHYDRLPAGQHAFEVVAAHVDGPWGREPARIIFRIPPLVQETAWFRASVGFAALATAAAGGAAWIRLRHRRQHEAAERIRVVERERARIARDLHDDLGASLTEIDLLGALAERSGADSAAAAEHLHELRFRAHRTVAALDEIVWAVNPGNDTLGSLRGYIADFVQQFLRATVVRCELDLASGPDGMPLAANVRHAVFQATKEAVHNVVQHADATVCRVRLQVRAGTLEVEVCDDGRGIMTATEGFRPGDGLGNMATRLAAVGGRCTVVPVVGGGTRVILAAPLVAAASWVVIKER